MVMRPGLALLLFVCLPLAVQAESGRWQKIEGSDCEVWNDDPQPQETVSWDGFCLFGKADGHGTLVWRFFDDFQWKKSTYRGEMQGGKQHGRGVKTWANGDRYEGEYRDDKRHGHGVYTWPETERYPGERYEGEYRNDKKHGHGVHTWTHGGRYEGEYEDGYPDGWGTYTKNGNTYAGLWSRGCFNDGTKVMAIGRSMSECR